MLATKRRRRLKLLDAAASRVGASLPLHVTVREKRKREEEEAAAREKASGKKKVAKFAPTGGLEFLQDNIGRKGQDDDRNDAMAAALKEDEEAMDDDGMEVDSGSDHQSMSNSEGEVVENEATERDKQKLLLAARHGDVPGGGKN